MSPNLIGHQDQRTSLRKLVLKDKLPSTIMLAGPSGVGKHLVALEVAQLLVCVDRSEKGACHYCGACKLFEAGNYPDLIDVNCADRNQSGVEEIREVLGALSLRSFSGDRRIVILRDCESLNTQSANVLLKTLEEPRPGTYFILTTASPSKLPPTVLSRCQVWFFDQLDAAKVKAILEHDPKLLESLTHEDANRQNLALDDLVILADGSLDNIAHFSAHHSLWWDIKLALTSVLKGDLIAGTEFTAKIGKDKDLLKVGCQLMRIFARSQMHQTADDTERTRWAVFVSELMNAEYLIFERNLSAAYVLQHLLINLCPVTVENARVQLPHGVTLLREIAV